MSTSRIKNIPYNFPPAGVVGIVDSPGGLRAIRRRLPPVDWLEWRGDSLPDAMPPATRLPWIVTVRHPAEGGGGHLDIRRRMALFRRLLPSATAIDIEVRSLHALAAVADEARAAGVLVIASFHDFRKTPATAKLRETVRRATEAGADAVKIATHTSGPGDVARLLVLLESPTLPTAVMGMGPQGMASRLLFASCGSILNYGWIDRPNVPGQWRAEDLKKTLLSLRSSPSRAPSLEGLLSSSP